jgi:hypothetical protein
LVSANACWNEAPCSLAVASYRNVDVDELTELLDRAVDIAPRASDLDVGLVDEPAVPDRVPGRACRVGQQRCELLYPPVDRDVINLDATFGEQLLDVAVGQSEPQIPTDRKHDRLVWEPEPGELRRGRDPETTRRGFFMVHSLTKHGDRRMQHSLMNRLPLQERPDRSRSQQLSWATWTSPF